MADMSDDQIKKTFESFYGFCSSFQDVKASDKAKETAALALVKQKTSEAKDNIMNADKDNSKNKEDDIEMKTDNDEDKQKQQ
jgi:hypothetical protein